jgi:hypothetical protein
VASLEPSPSALGEIRAALDEYRSAGYQLAITALYVLLCPPLLIGHDYQAALELIEHGLATTSRNSERILEAELYRLKARVLVVRGGPNVQRIFDLVALTDHLVFVDSPESLAPPPE